MYEYIIISISVRALAESAIRAGHKVSVIDCFSDIDTELVSDSVHKINCNENGFLEDELLSKVQEILKESPKAKLVLGSGFESNPDLIDKLKSFALTYSNTKEIITKLKEPFLFSDLLEKHEIAYPAIQRDKPDFPESFLIKKVAGHGGEHIKRAASSDFNFDTNYYYQKYVQGNVYSVLFLADGVKASIIGFNLQLTSDEFSDMPFLYKGAIKLNNSDIKQTESIENIINIIVNESGLSGLCGMDYIVNENGEVVVLEINPRPPATIELHENKSSLFAAHLAAIDKNLLDVGQETVSNEVYRGYAILYAKEHLMIRNNIDWPDWVKDIPQANSHVQIRNPVCTVYAIENSLDKVKSMLFNRLLEIETRIATTEKIN